VHATLLISRADRLRGGDVITALQAIPEVVRCDIVSGDLDLVVQVQASEPQHIRDIWDTIAALEGVRDITTALSLRTPIDRTVVG
jgi:DNA-binding Lrp family transcriptional regulator